MELTNSWFGYVALATFVLAYLFVIGEEFLHLRKSKPMLLAAGIIWALIGMAYVSIGDAYSAGEAFRHNFEEYAELLLFLIVAMTFINTLEERRLFDALRVLLVSKGFSYLTIFWLTGILAFFISSVADNLTTALIMSAVAMAVAGGHRTFTVLSCISIVVAANAGGAFSPFGDITTLMVWQKGLVGFTDFFALFVPSLVNWLVPAFFMSFSLPKDKPVAVREKMQLKPGGLWVLLLFILTIVLAVAGHNFLHLPPVAGMMMGLGLLKLYGFYLRRIETQRFEALAVALANIDEVKLVKDVPFDIFNQIARSEWDTLLFFYGVVMCVGGLGTMGYLALVSQSLYGELGATSANVLIGILSAVVDNIPVMYAVLSMNPDMSLGQWLLVTMTAGVGGSLLSVGSAAGVALMGQARGVYTFFSHLRWTWAIALGYAASIWVHFLINESLFQQAHRVAGH